MYRFVFILIAGLAITLSSCGGCGFSAEKDISDNSERSSDDRDSDRKSDRDDKKDKKKSDNPFANLEKTLEDLSDGKSVEPIHYEEIQKILPDKIGKFKQEELSGQTTGAMGFSVTNVEGTYINGEGKVVTITVNDVAGLGAGLMGLATWASLSIDKKDKNGYEKTTDFMGHKSFEKFKNGDSELAMIVEDRFIVTISAPNCPMSDLKKFAERMGINKLRKLI